MRREEFFSGNPTSPKQVPLLCVYFVSGRCRLEKQRSDVTQLAEHFGLLDEVNSKWETTLRPDEVGFDIWIDLLQE